MAAKKGPVNRGASGRPRPDDAGEVRTAADGPGRGPQSVQPWGTTGGTEDRDAPWGASEDSPMDEGSEPTGLPPGRRGERRADEQENPWPPTAGRHGFGSVEPTRVPEAGPGATPPESVPAHNPVPGDTPLDDLRNNPLEEQTGMHSEGVARRE